MDASAPRNSSTPSPGHFDVVIVGGGFAGLSAALMLGRARRHVLVVDDNEQRNRPVRAAYGTIFGEGARPRDLLEAARKRLEPYDVTLRFDRVQDMRRAGGLFSASLRSGADVTSDKVILATGVGDSLPDIEGLDERWGKSVFHCPYCHGWENQDQPIAILASGSDAHNLVGLMRGWSHDLHLFTHGPHEMSADELEHVRRLGVPIREEPIARLEGVDGDLKAIVLTTGESVPRSALYLKPRLDPHSELAISLGCELGDEGFPEASRSGETSVPGVYVAGDVGQRVHLIVAAIASGTAAAVAINEELLKEEFSESEVH